jgi:DNA invertase Pin-like site-specific DNA recombinase
MHAPCQESGDRSPVESCAASLWPIDTQCIPTLAGGRALTPIAGTRFAGHFWPDHIRRSWYVENESGAKLARPELFRLLADAHAGDILLVEQVDRLSRLTAADWDTLKAELTAKRIRVVALDLPTSWMMATKVADEFTSRMFEAINGMLLDMLAAVARKDYEDPGAASFTVIGTKGKSLGLIGGIFLRGLKRSYSGLSIAAQDA